MNLVCLSAGVNELVQSLTLSELGVARVAYSEQVHLNNTLIPQVEEGGAALLLIIAARILHLGG